MNPSIKFITEFPDTANYYDEETWYKQHENACVIVNCFSSGIYYPEHWTPLSIKCVCRGKEYYKFKDLTYAVNDDNFLLLNEGKIYESYINSVSVTESLSLNFTRKNIEDLCAFVFCNEVSLLDDPGKKATSGLKVFEKLYPHNFKTYSYLHSIRKYRNSNNTNANHLLETLYLFLEEIIKLNNITSNEIDDIQAKKRVTREELYKRLHTAKDYIQSCYHEDISLDSLSKICYLNPFHLLREFKKYFKTTPHKYLTSVRLKEAKKIIEHTDKSITDAVTEIGFEDLSSFSRLFKTYYGVSPQHYRRSINA